MARSRRAAPTISERVGGVRRARAAAPRARNDSVDSGLISLALPPVYRTSPTVSLPERGDDDCEIDTQRQDRGQRRVQNDAHDVDGQKKPGNDEPELWPLKVRQETPHLYNPATVATFRSTQPRIKHAGNVSTQAMTILRATPQPTAFLFFTVPTPRMAPLIACVVLIGMPKRVAISMTVAAAVSAANP